MDGSDRYDSDDDVFRFLDFSEPEPLPLPPIPPSPPPPPPPPPPLPPPLCDGIIIPDQEALDAIPEDQLWDINFIGPIIEGLAGVSMGDGNAGNESYENPDPIFVPLTPGVLDCSRCFVLRELLHTNGFENTKVVIHGGICAFYHAIFEVEHAGEWTQHYFLDLGMQPHHWVKNFLQEYTARIVNSGSVILHDSISGFYHALCGGISNDVPSSSTAAAPDSQPVALPELGESSSSSRVPRSNIAAQRERTGKMRLEDVADYFHLPISNAAKELNICSTALKHICRKHGLRRWPHRKIRSIDKKISRLEAALRSNRSSEETASIQEEIEKQRGRRGKICTGDPRS